MDSYECDPWPILIIKGRIAKLGDFWCWWTGSDWDMLLSSEEETRKMLLRWIKAGDIGSLEECFYEKVKRGWI